MKAIVSGKGRVTIPKPSRTALDIRPGAVHDLEADEDRLVARKSSPGDAFDELYGTLSLDELVDHFVERIRRR